MAYINFQRSFIRFKVVYYGPGLCGKTTNLERLHKMTHGAAEIVSIDTEGDRTICFDYMPLELGKIGGIETIFKLYTVPGQVRYNRTRQMVLRDVDGVVFVADSQRPAMDVNIESLANLAENLSEQEIDLQGLPFVFQYNKRDLGDVCSVEELERALNPRGRRSLAASALRGENVKETFAAIANEVYGVAAEKYGLTPGLTDADGMRAAALKVEALAAQAPAVVRYLSSIPPALPEGADDWKSLSSSRPPFAPLVEGHGEATTLSPDRRPISDASELQLSGMEKRVLAQLAELRQILEQIVMSSVDRDELEELEAGGIDVQRQMAQQIARNTERLEELQSTVVGLDRTMNGLREAIARDIRREVDTYLTGYLESRERGGARTPNENEPPLALEPVEDDEPTVQQRHEVRSRKVTTETQPPPRHFRRGRYSGPGQGS
jgi:signal recognition particle receptor subunit beta